MTERVSYGVAELLKQQIRAAPWLKRLGAGLSLRNHGFDPTSVYVRFVVDEVTLGQVFFFIGLRFTSARIITQMVHIDLHLSRVIISVIK